MRALFRNRQWAVTAYGLEAIGAPVRYEIPKGDLRAPLNSQGWTWIDHMTEKRWVDPAAFAEAYARALEIHKLHH